MLAGERKREKIQKTHESKHKTKTIHKRIRFWRAKSEVKVFNYEKTLPKDKHKTR